MAHDVGVHVEPVSDSCLHAPTSSSAFAHGMSAFRAARAPQDTLTMYPDWHTQASTLAPPAGTGQPWRFPAAAIPGPGRIDVRALQRPACYVRLLQCGQLHAWRAGVARGT